MVDAAGIDGFPKFGAGETLGFLRSGGRGSGRFLVGRGFLGGLESRTAGVLAGVWVGDLLPHIFYGLIVACGLAVLIGEIAEKDEEGKGGDGGEDIKKSGESEGKAFGEGFLVEHGFLDYILLKGKLEEGASYGI